MKFSVRSEIDGLCSPRMMRRRTRLSPMDAAASRAGFKWGAMKRRSLLPDPPMTLPSFTMMVMHFVPFGDDARPRPETTDVPRSVIRILRMSSPREPRANEIMASMAVLAAERGVRRPLAAWLSPVRPRPLFWSGVSASVKPN